MTRVFRLLLVICAITPFLWAFAPVSNKKMSGSPRNAPPATEVLVAAAADLKFAMDSLVAIFSKTHPDINIKVVYGSSGNFFEQISNGAPFDIFFSADADYPRKLKEQNKTISDVRLYGTGQLVLWS